jgi:transposase-like protein
MKDSNPPKPGGKDKGKDKATEQAKEFINKYRQSFTNSKSINTDVLLHLAALKRITSQHKRDKPDAAFVEIQQHLGDAESSETLRQERWHGTVVCIYCNSKHIKRVAKEQQKSEHNHRYLCLDCGEAFNDDTETKIEAGVPPLNSWMLCWYLLGCTNSLQYIASKLGLSMTTIEMMVHHMQKIFKAEQPLTHMLSFEEWSAQHGIKYKPVIEAAIAKQTVLYGMDIAGVAKDTAEYRRMKDRARGIEPTKLDGSKGKNKPRPVS